MKKRFFKLSAIGIMVILLLSLILTGCGPGAAFDQPAITSVTLELAQDGIDGASPTPVVSPAPGTTPNQEQQQQAATGVPIRISIEVANFDFVNEIGDTEGDGYVIYYMDELPEVIQREAEAVAPGLPGAAPSAEFRWRMPLWS